MTSKRGKITIKGPPREDDLGIRVGRLERELDALKIKVRSIEARVGNLEASQ